MTTEESSERNGADDVEYVSVLETSDSTLLPVIKSMLESAGVPFIVEGEDALGILPVGGAGGGASLFSKGIVARVLVPSDRREEAEELIRGTPEADV